jgi:hypothetical protein
MPVHAKQLVLCTNIHCTRGVFTDDECKPFCPDCGSPCIELCPNPDCRVRILDVLQESDLQSCPRCGEKWMYDPNGPGTEQKCCE